VDVYNWINRGLHAFCNGISCRREQNNERVFLNQGHKKEGKKMIEFNALVLDTETGGLNCKQHNLCSVALKVFDRDIKKAFYIKPNPRLLCTKEAMDINGLRAVDLQVNGLSELEAVNEITSFIHKHFDRRPHLLGQNVLFDKGFISELFKRNNRSFEDLVHYQYQDTMLITNFLRYAGKIAPDTNTKLSETYKALCLKETPQTHHNALTDVLITEELFKKQIEIINGGK
jgi:DNA polymerase III epsilon subunit-like protein